MCSSPLQLQGLLSVEVIVAFDRGCDVYFTISAIIIVKSECCPPPPASLIFHQNLSYSGLSLRIHSMCRGLFLHLITFKDTQTPHTLCRTSLDEGSASRRDFYRTTHNTTDRHPCHRWDSNPQSQQATGRRTTP